MLNSDSGGLQADGGTELIRETEKAIAELSVSGEAGAACRERSAERVISRKGYRSRPLRHPGPERTALATGSPYPPGRAPRSPLLCVIGGQNRCGCAGRHDRAVVIMALVEVPDWSALGDETPAGVASVQRGRRPGRTTDLTRENRPQCDVDSLEPEASLTAREPSAMTTKARSIMD